MNARRRRNIHNRASLPRLVALLLLQHDPDLLLHAPEDAVHIHLEHGLHALRREVGESGEIGCHAGVVDGGVETAMETEDLGVEVGDLGLQGDVCCDEGGEWCVGGPVLYCLDNLFEEPVRVLVDGV